MRKPIEESDWVVVRLLVAMEDNTPEYYWNENMDYRKSCWYLYGKYGLAQIHAAFNSIREENKKYEIFSRQAAQKRQDC